jgi:nicotinic acid phosphoribosyltransferase
MVYSLLDQDFYKLTMAQCVFHNFSNIPVEYDLSILMFSAAGRFLLVLVGMVK